MAIVKWHEKKIDTTSYLGRLIDYLTRADKTNNNEFLSQYLCDYSHGVSDFLAQTERRKYFNDRGNIRHEYDMFYISFPLDEKNKKLLFETSQKIVDEYLNNEYQYLLTMHQDQEHYHVHCLFNCSNIKTNQMFRTSKANKIYKLRMISDKICEENGLNVILNPKKNTDISQREYYVRKYNRSFKSKVETLIDKIILEAKNIEDFKEKLSENAEVEFKEFSFIIKPENAKNFIRNKTLGADYLLPSIEYRINNKNLEFTKKPRFKFIDTSSKKFEDSPNLKKWAYKKNAEHSGELFNEAKNISKLDNIDIKTAIENEYFKLENIENNISSIDKNIEELMIAKRLHERFPAFIPMMKEYKSLSTNGEKQSYKKANIQYFKEFDLAKKYINMYKDEQGNKRDISYFDREINSLKSKRDDIYKSTYDVKRKILEYQRTYEVSKHLNIDRDVSKSYENER